jgi:hypothetical protein
MGQEYRAQPEDRRTPRGCSEGDWERSPGGKKEAEKIMDSCGEQKMSSPRLRPTWTVVTGMR